MQAGHACCQEKMGGLSRLGGATPRSGASGWVGLWPIYSTNALRCSLLLAHSYLTGAPRGFHLAAEVDTCWALLTHPRTHAHAPMTHTTSPAASNLQPPPPPQCELPSPPFLALPVHI